MERKGVLVFIMFSFLFASYLMLVKFSSIFDKKRSPKFKHYALRNSFNIDNTTAYGADNINKEKSKTWTSSVSSDPAIKEIRRFLGSPIVISFYTSFFDDLPWPQFVPKSNYKTECNYAFKDCLITYDMKKWKNVDVLFFHARDMPSKDKLKLMLNQRKKGQVWIYFVMENPFNTPPVAPLDDIFDLTGTYRLSSDLFYPYESYESLDQIQQKAEKKITKNYAEGKDKQVAWMVSHCGTLRDSLAKKFEQHGLSIYVGGGCAENFKNKLSCPNRDCLDVLKKFKFYFSAENNLCDNYITEKYWRNPFRMEAVAITLGGSNYSDPRLAIPGSFINALDFKTPKDLIDYIKLVDKNDTLYNSYFEWKKYYRIRTEPYGCSLQMNNFCTKLRDGIKLRKNPLTSEIDRQKECGIQESFYRDWINR